MHDTVPALFQEAVAHHEDRPALRVRRDGAWTGMTYRELADAVEEFARGLHTLGLEPRDRVGVLAPNAPEWQVADLGALHARAVTVPMYWNGSVADTLRVLRDARLRFLVVQDAATWRALAAEEDAPAIEHVITITDSPDHDGPTLASVREAGRRDRERDPDAFDATWNAVRPEVTATLAYADGIAGVPHGAMITHGALSYCAQQARDLLDLGPRDVTVMFLPLAHAFERIAELTGLSAGVAGHYSASRHTLAEDIRDVRPTVLYAVPRVFEGLRDRVMRDVASKHPAHRRFFEWALGRGDKAAHYRERGWFVPPWLGVEEGVARALAFRDIRNRLGGRMRFFVSGGGPLNPDVGRFFFAAGVPVYEGYGLPEGGPIVTLNWPLAYRLGSAGKPLPGTEVRVSKDGEILVRGPGLMRGYWEDPEATEAVLGDRWLHTGELGAFDDQGFLYVHGRRRNVITLADGTRVAPVPVEKRLEESPFIEQAAVFGDGRPHLVALLVPDDARLRRDLEWKTASRDDLAHHAAVRMILTEEVGIANAGFPEAEQVREFHVHPEPFTVRDGTLTPTLKIRRDVVADRARDALAALYDAAGKP